MAGRGLSPALAVALFGCMAAGAADQPPVSTIEVKPGESVQKAIDAAKPGDTVLIRPGTYKASARGEAMIVVRAAQNGVTLRGAGESPDQVVLDGDRLVLHVLFLDKGIGRATVIENLTVTGGLALPAKVLPPHPRATLRPELDNVDNDFYHDGAGLMLFVCSPTVRNCRIVGNRADRCGGGISVFCPDGEAFPAQGQVIVGNEIRDNTVDESTGGGIDVYFRAKADIVNNLFVGNKGWGGAVAVLDNARAVLRFNTLVANRGSVPGVALTQSARIEMADCIFAGNLDGPVLEIAGKLTATHCCFWNNAEEYTPPRGKGHITADPLFVAGPRGKYYLSQAAAGQAAKSPCLDAGSQAAASSDVRGLTTRTDEGEDTATADIGFHYARKP